MLINCRSGASEVWVATDLDIQTTRAWQEAHRGGFGTRCEAPEIRLMKRKERMPASSGYVDRGSCLPVAATYLIYVFHLSGHTIGIWQWYQVSNDAWAFRR